MAGEGPAHGPSTLKERIGEERGYKEKGWPEGEQEGSSKEEE